MKKNAVKLFSLVLTAVILLLSVTSCKKKDNSIYVENETTVIENPTKEVSEYSANEQIYVLAGALKGTQAYRSEITGETKTAMYTQKIHDIHIKNGDESYLKAVSTSALVNVGKEAFFLGDKAVIRNADDVQNNEWSDEYSVISLKDYRAQIGGTPEELSNYILNDDTIISAESKALDDGTYSLTVKIDPEEGTARYAVKMMNYGRLSSVPKFIESTVVINFNSDWTINYLESKDNYKISLFGLKVECSSEMKETFEYSETVEVPNNQIFREKIGNDLDDLGQTVEKLTGKDLLIKTIAETDFKNGISVSGKFYALKDGQKVEIPMEAWVSFDMITNGVEGIADTAQGRLKLGSDALSTEIMYNGDGWLYVDVANTKYKYKIDKNISDSDSDIKLDDVFSWLTISEKEKQGNEQKFEIVLSAEGLKQLNKVLNPVLEDLSALFKDFSFKSIKAEVVMHERDGKGSIESVKASCKTSMADAECDILIAQKHEDLPKGNELNAYVQADFDNFINNFKTVEKIVTAFSAYGWNNGVEFTLNVGSDSVMKLPLKVQIQIQPGNFRGHLDFALGALVKLPTDFYIEKGNLYIVSTTKDANKNKIATNVEVVNLFSMISSMGSSNSNIEIDSIFSLLVDTVLNSKVKTTVLQDGTERTDIIFSENMKKIMAKGYSSILNTMKQSAGELGPMGALVINLAKMLDYPVKTAYIRSEYKEDSIVKFGICLDLDGKDATGKPSDIMAVLEIGEFKNLKAEDSDSIFDVLYKGIPACEESAAVRAMASKILKDDIQWLGQSYFTRFTQFEEAYNKLSDSAKATVSDYQAVMKLKAKWQSLHNASKEFIKNVRELAKMNRDGATPEQISEKLKLMNPAYVKFNAVQKEFIGEEYINDYLAIRSENEKLISVPAINKALTELTVVNYPTGKEFKDALTAIEKSYYSLLEDSKKLVEDYENKHAAVKLVLRELQLKETNVKAGEIADKIEAEKEFSEATLKQLNDEVKAFDRSCFVLRLTDEEKAGLTEYKRYTEAKAKLEKINSQNKAK